VALTHRNIAVNVAAVLESFPIGPADVLLSVLPLHHTFECTMGLLMPLSVGARVVYARGLKSKELVEDLRAGRSSVHVTVEDFEEFLGDPRDPGARITFAEQMEYDEREEKAVPAFDALALRRPCICCRFPSRSYSVRVLCS